MPNTGTNSRCGYSLPKGIPRSACKGEPLPQLLQHNLLQKTCRGYQGTQALPSDHPSPRPPALPGPHPQLRAGGRAALPPFPEDRSSSAPCQAEVTPGLVAPCLCPGDFLAGEERRRGRGKGRSTCWGRGGCRGRCGGRGRGTGRTEAEAGADAGSDAEQGQMQGRGSCRLSHASPPSRLSLLPGPGGRPHLLRRSSSE